MAENKKGFILYCDLIHTVEQLPDNKAGELFKHILRYVNDLNPKTEDLITNITFEPIKQQLKRDLNKWQEKSSKRSEAGRLGGFKSGEARKANASTIEANEANALIVEANEANASNLKQNEQVTVTDTVTDTVTVKVTDTVKEEEEEIKSVFNFRKSLINFGVDKTLVSEWLVIRKNKKLTNTQTSFNAIQREISKSNKTPNECIKIAVEKSWGGFEAAWLQNIKTNNNNKTGITNLTGDEVYEQF